MSEHQDHSQSEFESRGAERFWGEFSRTGGRRETRREGSQPTGGNGLGGGPAPEHGHECLDWCPICRTADVLRATTSPELREQFQGLQRDAVETLRALLESYIERLDEAKRPEATRVEDIPIE